MAKANVRVIKSDKAAKLTTSTPDGVSNIDARYARVGKACGELEGDFNDLANMAKLAIEALEDGIGGDHSRITKNRDLYYLPSDQTGAMLFAVHHLYSMILKCRDAYLEALELDGEGK